MKKKIIIISIILLLILLISYFAYKGINLFKYNLNNISKEDYNNITNGLEVKDTIEVNTIISDEYLVFENIKVKNYFKDFTKLDSSSETSDQYVIYDENNEIEAAFWFGITDTYVNMFESDFNVYSGGENTPNFDNKDATRFFKNNNIINDIDLFKYIREHKDDKSNIFTSIKKMRENYAIYFLTLITLPAVENITLIEGDYTGYILNGSNFKECSILYNDKRYIFLFLGKEYFTSSHINEILNTIVID